MGKIQWTWLPQNEAFHSHLNIEDNTDTDYAHAKKVGKDFDVKI